MMRMGLIESDQELESLCQQLDRCELLTMDTEFLRVRTYYPKLCLFQVGCGQEIFCIDPLEIDAGHPGLRHTLLAGKAVKVFHAARQDIEVLHRYCGAVPQNVFDTQVAAAMLGLGDQVGYAGLVEQITGATLTKAHTRTDWCRRPLRSEQIEYAVDDVRYLEPIYEYLCERLQKHGRLQWVFEECSALSNAESYHMDPQTAYTRIGHGEKLEPVAQGVLKELAIWREHTSQSLDLPRSWVAKDVTLASIARARPLDIRDLKLVEGVTESFTKRYGAEIVRQVQRVADNQHHPVIWSRGRPLNADQRALRRQVMDCLAKVSKEAGISLSLLGSRDEVERLVRGRRDVNLLTGWRAHLLGEELNAILA